MDKDIKAYIDTVNNWTSFKMIFIVPIFIFMMIGIPSLFIKFFRYTYNTPEAYGKFNSNAIEFKFAIDDRIIMIFVIISSILSLWAVIHRKKNKIKSIFIINVVISVLTVISVYQFFVVFQLLIANYYIKLINWLLFPLPIIIIFLVKLKFLIFSKRKCLQIQ